MYGCYPVDQSVKSAKRIHPFWNIGTFIITFFSNVILNRQRVFLKVPLLLKSSRGFPSFHCAIYHSWQLLPIAPTVGARVFHLQDIAFLCAALGPGWGQARDHPPQQGPGWTCCGGCCLSHCSHMDSLQHGSTEIPGVFQLGPLLLMHLCQGTCLQQSTPQRLGGQRALWELKEAGSKVGQAGFVLLSCKH